MPETAVKTRSDASLAAARQLFTQEVYQPELLRAYIDALKQAVAHYKRTGQEIPNDLITKKGFVKLDDIIAALTQFNQTLSSDLSIKELDLNDLTHLDRLDSAIITVSGAAASPEAAQPTTANIPPNLKELTQIYQSAIEAKAKRENLTKPQIDEYIAKQITPVIIQTGVVKQAAKIQLGFVIDNSQYLENLAAALGRKPEVVKRLAKMRLDQIIDEAVTTQALTQARLISPDTSQLTTLFVRNLQKELDFDDLLGTAVRTNKNDAKKAIESIKKTVAEETAKAKPAIEAAAKNLQEHPTVAAAARRAAQEAVKQVKPDIPPAKAARLNSQLVKHQDNPSIQKKLIIKTLGVSPSQADSVLNSLKPSVSRLAASTQRFNPILAADPDGIAAEALRHPHLFPKPFVDAIKSGKITDAEVAEIFHMARLLDIPADAIILRKFGVNAQNLAANLQAGKKWLGIIPMGHGVDLQDASIAKLSDLAAAQKQLADALKSPPQFLPDRTATQFLKTSRAAARSVRFSEFLDKINPFLLPSALSYNFPPLSALGNASAGFSAKWRVDFGPLDGALNFLTSLGNTARSLPDFAARPFRAVGNAISNTIINPVKTWANTQIKDGLARAGAWLAKKGLTKAAKDIGMGLVGKGTAALLAQAVPVAGQIAGIAALLLSFGDIGKFIWEHKNEIGIGLGGLYLFGLKALSALINLLGSAAWTLGGAAIGFALGGPIGAAIGGTIGWLIGSGALGSVLSGLGSALGSAAASLSSFIGALTAPSAFIGLGSTIATAGLLGVGIAWALQTFFIQPNINSALFVADDKGTSAPGGGIPPENVNAQCSDISGTKYCFPVAPLSGVNFPCSHHDYRAVDIFTNGDQPPPTDDQHLPVVAYIGGTVYWVSATDDAGGLAFNIAGDDGRYYYYAHNIENYVSLGQRVETGQVIALTDTTGNAAGTWEHLHFGISTIKDMRTKRCRPGVTTNCVSDAIYHRNIGAMIAPVSPGGGGDFQEKLGISCPQHSPGGIPGPSW